MLHKNPIQHMQSCKWRRRRDKRQGISQETDEASRKRRQQKKKNVAKNVLVSTVWKEARPLKRGSRGPKESEDEATASYGRLSGQINCKQSRETAEAREMQAAQLCVTLAANNSS